MRQPDLFRARPQCSASRIPFSALLFVLFLIISSASCGGNSCIVAVWNFNGTISTGNGSCSLTTTANGSTRVRLSTAEAPARAPIAPNLLHVFVTLNGIEANPSADAAEANSAEWQELAPELVREPAQVDLMASGGTSCQSVPTWRAAIPANQYRQIRLRLASESQNAQSTFPAQNQCGSAGIHCVVTARGEIRPLVLERPTSEILIPAGQIADGGFGVLPDEEIDLAIEFQSFASMATPIGEAVRIEPVFSVVPARTCESSLAADKQGNLQ